MTQLPCLSTLLPCHPAPQEVLLHLTEFLRTAMPLEGYAAMLPPPEVLR